MVDPSFLQSVNVSILPRSDNAYDLGSSSYRWKKGYFANKVISGRDFSIADGVIMDTLLSTEETIGFLAWLSLVQNDYFLFNPPDKYEYDDGSGWVEGTIDDSLKSIFMGKTGSFVIPNGRKAVRFTWSDITENRYFRLFYMIVAGNTPIAKITFEASGDGTSWTKIGEWSAEFPGNPKLVLIWKYIRTATYGNYFRITIEPDWTTGSNLSIRRMGMLFSTSLEKEDYILRKLFNWDFDRNLFTRSILPNTDNSYDLGSSSLRWKKLYTYYLDLKEDLGASIKFNSATQAFHIENIDGKFRIVRTGVDYPFVIDGVNGRIGLWTNSPSEKLHVNGNIRGYNLFPDADNTYDLGSSSLRWRNGYFAGKLETGLPVGFGTSGVGSKVVIRSTDSSCGQLQIGNPSGDEASICYIPKVTGFGSSPSSNAGYAFVAGVNVWGIGAKSWGIGEKLVTGSWVWKVDHQGNVTQKGNLLPSVDNSLDFGASSYRWKNGYFTGIITAGDYVSGIDGAGIIAGGKGGGKHLIINDIDGARWALATGGYDLTFYKHKSDTDTWEEALRLEGDGATNTPLGMTVSGFIRPKADNTYDLGSSSLRWRNGYFAGTVYINTDIHVDGHWYWKPSKNFQLYPTANGQEWSFDLRNQDTYSGCYWHVWSDTKYTILKVEGDTGYVKTRELMPLSDNSFNLGSSSLRWKNGYFAGNLNVGGVGNLGSLQIGGIDVIDSGRNIKNVFDIIPENGVATTSISTTFIWDLFMPYKFAPRTYDYDTSLIKIEYWDEASGTWVDDTASYDSTQIKKVFRGDVTGSIAFQNGKSTKFRIHMPNDGAYRYIHAVFLAFCSYDNRFRLRVYGVKSDGETEVLKAESHRDISGWPGMAIMLFENYLRYHPTSDYIKIILEFEITWGTGGYNVVINKILLWGMYPYTSYFRRMYVDEDMNTRFAGGVFPTSDNSYDLGSSSYRWKNICFAGNLIGGVGNLGSLQIGGTEVIDASRILKNIASVAQNLLPNADNSYDLGSSSKRWKNGYFAGLLDIGELSFNGLGFLKTGISAYKIKHSEGSHPTRLYDLIQRFVFKYLNNIQAETVITNLSHTWSDDKYTGIYATLVYIANNGNYDFGVNSDDASAVFVDGILAVCWLNGHGTSSTWYEKYFNSYWESSSTKNADLHPNGIYLSKGWHLIVAVFEEVSGGDKIEVYMRPNQGETPGSGTNTAWALVGESAKSAGYILDYKTVPLGFALNMLRSWWKAESIPIYDIADGHYVIRAGLKSYGEIVPSSDNSYDLGSSSYRWKNGYFAGDIYVAGNKVWHAGNDGAGSGLDADTVDGKHASAFALTDLSNVSDSTILSKLKNVDGSGSGLDADLLDGKHAGNSSGQIPVSNGTKCTNLNADLLDGYHAGNSSGQIPISNGTKCTNLNADMVDGEHASAFTHARNGGKNIWVQSSAPTAQDTGDIWIKTS